MSELSVRPMRAGDWPRVAEILLQGIRFGNATFRTECPGEAEWDADHFHAPRLVAEREGRVVGWVALSPTSSMHAYRGVAEVSIYVDNAAQGQGVGSLLLDTMAREAAAAGFWTLHSSIFRDNAGSIALHTSCGFRMIGYRERIGQDAKGRWRDTVLMEKRL